MATSTTEMGEIDEVHKDEPVLNGDTDTDTQLDNEDSQSSITKKSQTATEEDDEDDDNSENSDHDELESPANAQSENENENQEEISDDDDDEEERRCEDDEDEIDEEEPEKVDISSEAEEIDEEEEEEEEEDEDIVQKNGEIHEITDDDEEMDGVEKPGPKNGLKNDSDVVIIDEAAPKENGDKPQVIELDDSPMKVDNKPKSPRRSGRNMNKAKSYVENEKEQAPEASSEESDIEEVMPQDPLAIGSEPRRMPKANSATSSSTIVVKDTKRLVEIAAKSNNSAGNKKEPTLVIIDTNSILSGRGPVPVSASNKAYSAMLPMALPAQGMYPANMRATITPIPLNNKAAASSSATPVLPTLTDDMFVVEAPSFIVPYVYEKPPVSDFKVFVKEIADKVIREEEDDENEEEDGRDDEEKIDLTGGKKGATAAGGGAPYSYFESALGKFFIDIGFNLVQEYVQADLLKQQKRKRDREGGLNVATNKTIHSLIKTLEFSKENNHPFRQAMKKCEFCNFKTESGLVMAHHLETPHTKNYVYKCNFCAYEARSPHDILFHTEAEHAVRGRLERAASFHQCPNCPFEDNQKGKLTRHSLACARKFKPEKNMEPPIDWEPPAKIPRVPKVRQGINVSAYQAMKTNSQLQFLTKMQLLNQASLTASASPSSSSSSSTTNTHPLHRGRGRPALGSPSKPPTLLKNTGMVYKQTMSGGSVLVPTNYQLSGNQVYQVVGGQELGVRLNHTQKMSFVPNAPSASSSTLTLQQNQAKSKSVHQPSISITPLPRTASTTPNTNNIKPGDTNSNNSFVICEICDGYIKDLEQLRNHMQWIHKVKIHPKMIYNRPPLNCQKCQFRFFTDQGLERHLLGSHGLVTSSMQDAANKSKDAGRCPVCGRVYQWKLLNHVARDHSMTLKPAHLSYKCTVCTATFGMYKQFENHVYSAHSVVAKRVMDKKGSSANKTSNNKSDQLMKPLKINDEITIIPQPAKAAGTSKEGSPSSGSTTSNSRNSTPGTSKNPSSTSTSAKTENSKPSCAVTATAAATAD